ncbi:hypothetical protein DYB32_005558 [Aphanomyces invadans]|uniref:DNA polymerase delta subunit OB-fold domain-containing protein n=1 Tax=Aphanomyces invadans TaxID=157072 RepID=A0A3R6YY05_9STRA|nr:hypothetical protein DYB32_005558 [Aphanomyces invadans]
MGQDDVSFPVPRKTASCEYEHQRFVLKKKSFDQQYSHMYVSRLRALEPQVRANIPQSSAHVPILPKIIDLSAGDQCVVIGTIFRVLAKKPNILDEFVVDEVLVLQEESTCLASDADQLLLEDESGRVALFGNIRMEELVTGVVVGLQGEMREDGDGFHVMHVFTPTLPPQLPLPNRTDDAYVALVSGLEMGSDACDPAKTSLLVDYLAGRVGTRDEKIFVSSIVRCIVAGNTISKPAKDTHTLPVRRSHDCMLCHILLNNLDRQMDDMPHVLFAGNQPSFQSSVVQGKQDRRICMIALTMPWSQKLGEGGQVTRVIAVPSFVHTGVVVLVNLRDLSVVPLTFQ